jgi:hypothetical protein
MRKKQSSLLEIQVVAYTAARESGRPVARDRPPAGPGARKRGESVSKTRTILIVDDEPELANELAEQLALTDEFACRRQAPRA